MRDEDRPTVADWHPRIQVRRPSPFGLGPAIDYPSDLFDLDFDDCWDVEPGSTEGLQDPRR